MKAVVVPSEIYMPTVVAQPNCPIKIEEANIGKMMDGTERPFFRARNISGKPIALFQIQILGSNGSSLASLFPYKRIQKVIAPGEVAPPGLSEESVQFISLDKDLKQQLRLTGKMRLIVFFMVLKVDFEDGSTYDATPLLNSLEEHLRLFDDKYDKAAPYLSP